MDSPTLVKQLLNSEETDRSALLRALLQDLQDNNSSYDDVSVKELFTILNTILCSTRQSDKTDALHVLSKLVECNPLASENSSSLYLRSLTALLSTSDVPLLSIYDVVRAFDLGDDAAALSQCNHAIRPKNRRYRVSFQLSSGADRCQPAGQPSLSLI